MITFTERDTIDGFELFMETFYFKGDYTFRALLNIFLKFLDKDIRNGYPENEQEQVRQLTKKHIYRHFKNIDFSVTYNKEEILDIVFGQK